ncbi:hypothetical protein BN1232_03636 [Mycobacterium lentiflavum]|uniref:DUF2505 domain-containing protein n=1 Tax=Mycobacterium lentiflavum TaxID=141349 RepID=A0A0E3WCW2_MYCLN|nr:DUF2505 domain-containing protein [Mycobacterium lentiflavum]MEE3063964.1 DUF2505 domain-containing protein [Actinomycetota bacterium]ULP40754.1 DUF2505 domain-containing protein [Mycobacterium lentiflavum]CQD16757.1 hypothetical protein BN1232_03636 [Mycobacterium lentiflavum]
MPRSFDVSTESPASVEQIYWAFSREDYWLARIALGDAATTTLDSLDVDPAGRVTVRVTQHVGRQLLPGPVAKFAPGELKLVHEETWKPNGDGQVLGQVNVSTSPGVGGARAEAWLEPIGDGTQLRFAVKVHVKIPLVGGKLEKTLGAGLSDSIPAVQRFTTTWIADHS